MDPGRVLDGGTKILYKGFHRTNTMGVYLHIFYTSENIASGVSFEALVLLDGGVKSGSLSSGTQRGNLERIKKLDGPKNCNLPL